MRKGFNDIGWNSIVLLKLEKNQKKLKRLVFCLNHRVWAKLSQYIYSSFIILEIWYMITAYELVKYWIRMVFYKYHYFAALREHCSRLRPLIRNWSRNGIDLCLLPGSPLFQIFDIYRSPEPLHSVGSSDGCLFNVHRSRYVRILWKTCSAHLSYPAYGHRIGYVSIEAYYLYRGSLLAWHPVWRW